MKYQTACEKMQDVLRMVIKFGAHDISTGCYTGFIDVRDKKKDLKNNKKNLSQLI